MQRYDYSLKMNVLFYFKAKKAKTFSTWFSDMWSLLNLADRFLIYMYACMPWFIISLVEHDGNFLGLTGAIFNHKRHETSVTKMNYTGLITPQTKFQLDPIKDEREL